MKTGVVGLALTLMACGSVEYEHAAQRPVSTAMIGVTPQPTAVSVSVSIEIFYEQLAPYGAWLDVPQVGRAFVPHDPEYRPYRNGHWAQSGDDLVWVSYDAIGWAVCHYGSWAVLDDGRWAWLPDTEWGPAWVEWRENEGYVGWAPRMAYVAPATQVSMAWVFVETSYLLVDYISQVFVEPGYASDIYDSCPPMARRPDRRWLRERDVRRARASTVASRARDGGRRGGVSARGVTVRDGASGASAVPRASARSVVVRGPAATSGGLTERPRPRETVVLGGGVRGRAPRPAMTRVPGNVVVSPAPAGPRPHLELLSPRPAPAVNPAVRAPRVVRPMPTAPPPRIVRAPPRIVTAPRPPPGRVIQAPRPAPRIVTAPRRAPRIVTPRPPPRIVTAPRPAPRRVMQAPRPAPRPAPRTIRTAAPPRVYRPQPVVRAPAPVRTAPARTAPAPRAQRPEPRRQERRTEPSRPTTTTRRVSPAPAVGVRGARGVAVRRR